MLHAQNQLSAAALVLQGRRPGDAAELDLLSSSSSPSFASESLRKLGLHQRQQ